MVFEKQEELMETTLEAQEVLLRLHKLLDGIHAVKYQHDIERINTLKFRIERIQKLLVPMMLLLTKDVDKRTYKPIVEKYFG